MFTLDQRDIAMLIAYLIGALATAPFAILGIIGKRQLDARNKSKK